MSSLLCDNRRLRSSFFSCMEEPCQTEFHKTFWLLSYFFRTSTKLEDCLIWYAILTIGAKFWASLVRQVTRNDKKICGLSGVQYSMPRGAHQLNLAQCCADQWPGQVSAICRGLAMAFRDSVTFFLTTYAGQVSARFLFVCVCLSHRSQGNDAGSGKCHIVRPNGQRSFRDLAIANDFAELWLLALGWPLSECGGHNVTRTILTPTYGPNR